jgi:hypothetical protein
VCRTLFKRASGNIYSLSFVYEGPFAAAKRGAGEASHRHYAVCATPPERANAHKNAS